MTLMKVVFFCPATHVEQVKQAMFQAGAGKVGEYDHCSWQCKGLGQFRAGASATPYVGKIGEVENVEEWRVEMVCQESCISPTIDALKKAHPYETPAYDVVHLLPY